MENYLNLLERVMKEGTRQHNRTGIDTIRIEGAMLEFDLTKGFPAMTTKKLAFGAVKGELIGFIRGYRNAADFRDLGCKVWDQNANENKQWLANPHRLGEDDLGRIYGVQWRNWRTEIRTIRGGELTSDTCEIDQLKNAIWKIQMNPFDRRNIVTAWNPGELDQMALPPCHIMHQYICDPNTKELSMTMYQRSCDMFLGVPFNIASYALLLELVARATGYKAKKLVMFLADVHIYENHVPQVLTQLSRIPYELPTLKVELNPFALDGIETLEHVFPHDIELENYKYHPAIKADMAV